jgi:nucleoside-diphosphate-sugar epimerase
MNIFVTGSAAHLARALLPQLCAHPGVGAVTGVDLRQAVFAHPKFTHHVADMRGEAIPGLMRGCDALVHMAFVVLRGKMPLAAMCAINVQGTRQLFERARALGIGKRVHLSSASVYGAGDGMRETAPLAPVRGFAYAEQKAELERWFDGHDVEAIRLRPHVILGPHAQALLRRLIHQPFYLRLPDPQPQLQCVHEDDVAQAILAALFAPVSGPFNLASADTLSLRESIQRGNPRAIGIPPWLGQAALATAWRVSGWGGEPGWIDAACHPLNLDSQRARDLLGWRPRYTARETLAAT